MPDISWMLDPRHVGPRHARRRSEGMGRQRVEIRDVGASREQRERGSEEPSTPPVEQIGVVEVDVHELRQRATRKGTSEIAERMGRGNDAELAARGQLDGRGLRQRSPAFVLGEVRGAGRARRAVDVVEVRACLGDLRIRVPASPAEECRRQLEPTEPRSFVSDPRARCVARRPRVIRSCPVRVVPERSSHRGCACSLEPPCVVLAEVRIGRPHERGDDETTRSSVLQRGEPRPHRAVERSLNVARHDRVPFPRRGAHRARS